jgi:FtsH-binding integral membrane protein
MGLLDLLNHLLNFVAPACAVGLLLAVMAWVFKRKRPATGVVIAQAAINTVAGIVALALALWFFGRDGKMAAYAALVVVCATSQWLAMRRK